MKLIKQKNQFDCGIAVLAMYSNLPYSEIEKINPGYSITVSKMKNLLSKFTNKNFSIKKCKIKLNKIILKQSVYLISNGDYSHWICSDSNKVFDPSLNSGRSIRDYPNKNWDVLRVLSSTPTVALRSAPS